MKKKNVNQKGKLADGNKLSLTETISIILQIIFPIILCIAFHILCNKHHCSITTLPDWKHFSSLSDYFDLTSLIGYIFGFLILSLAQCLPFGGEKVKSLNTKQSEFYYYTNGFFSMITVLVTFLTFEYSGVIISEYISEHILPIVIAANLFFLIICLTIQVKSYFAPEWAIVPEELNTSFLSGFFNGRELNAHFLGMDVKFLFLRVYTTSMIVTDISILIRSFNAELASVINNLNYQALFSHPTLLVLVFLHVTYFASHLYHEHTIPSTRFVLSEPMGYKFVTTSFIWWSGLIAQTKYIAEHNIHYPTWELVTLLIINIAGQYLYVISNAEKDAFKKNPASPEFKSIPSDIGKNILCSGTWGFVRQPNILADLIIHLVWLRFGWNALPALGVLSVIQMLLERNIASQNDCKKRYGSGWDLYCKKVKYVIVPMIY